MFNLDACSTASTAKLKGRISGPAHLQGSCCAKEYAQILDQWGGRNRVKKGLLTSSINPEKSPATIHFSKAKFPIQISSFGKLIGSYPSALGFFKIIDEKTLASVHVSKRIICF